MSELNRIRIPDLQRKKKLGQKITMLTAYDATMARLLDRAGVDALLVGDSLGMVILGHDTTIPVTLDAMVHHASAVSRGAERAFVVADMPFLSWQASPADAIRNAGRLMQEGGVSAVKIEGGLHAADSVRRLVEIGIPVMAHIGLVPQAVHQLGGYRVAGRTQDEADRLVEDAMALEQAGAFGIVLECIPAEVAAAVTAKLAIPTIGIGAGPHCDGQVLVSYDAFGLYDEIAPKFVKQYAHLGDEMIAAAKQYIAEVEQGEFPDLEHSFRFPTASSSRS
ncbi:MAG TPA: 3-methyl-2-oxobutanoate hydroxymethyltransferase [Bryobacteraceae bacterium]|jgi:3-methyl-2-oxobutanoate hydroxymethyltransferase|nr:3-methyl-2-oxobutanoate hydroxymethyltransferase [Bryobacteraceae bacterium]